MLEIARHFWVAEVIALLIILRALALIREVLVARSIASGSLYGAHPLFPTAFGPIERSAGFLASRTEQVCSELVARMFALPPKRASRSTASWPVWQRAHIPAYAVCAVKLQPERQQILVRSV